MQQPLNYVGILYKRQIYNKEQRKAPHHERNDHTNTRREPQQNRTSKTKRRQKPTRQTQRLRPTPKPSFGRNRRHHKLRKRTQTRNNNRSRRQRHPHFSTSTPDPVKRARLSYATHKQGYGFFRTSHGQNRTHKMPTLRQKKLQCG